MLKSLGLKNFRGFREHRVEFPPFSLLIGQNNAEKNANRSYTDFGLGSSQVIGRKFRNGA